MISKLYKFSHTRKSPPKEKVFVLFVSLWDNHPQRHKEHKDFKNI